MPAPAPQKVERKYVSTVNACKLCTPLGACLAFRGIEGAMPLLHGSQGCSTYMRRYIISHFNEPIDIASSSLGEKNAIYGGAINLKKGITNVIRKYRPQLLGIATTCLTETIGDNVPMILKEYLKEAGGPGDRETGGPGDRKDFREQGGLPLIISVSTPSYVGTHMDGFHLAVKAAVESLAEGGEKTGRVNLLPGFVSPADLRYLKEIMEGFGLEYTLLPDISESLDAPILEEYHKIPDGGTPLSEIRAMGRAQATIEFGRTLNYSYAAGNPYTAADYLQARFDVDKYSLGLPIGINETDRFFAVLEHLSGHPAPDSHRLERGRLIDAYVDSHKYLFGLRGIVYGEEDLVIGLASFLSETGIVPVLCASGGKSGRFEECIRAVCAAHAGNPAESLPVREGMDFYQIAEEAESLKPDLLIGNSKGYPLARKLNIPLIRVGFPIHDRIGGQRILHLGYRGAQRLLDQIVNTVIEKKQNDSPVGYAYM
ncbi:MAG: nitrogenase component 1 [bacterium]